MPNWVQRAGKYRKLYRKFGITIRLWLTLIVLAIWVSQYAFPQTRTVVSVPFVGCESHDQAETYKAPTAPEKKVQITTSSAQKLAYYKAEISSGVLAPRGWHCFGVLGSSGSDFLITPQPLNRSELFWSALEKIKGPAIQVRESCSDNSGRFDMARVIARVFPKQKAFAQDILQLDDYAASEFPFGPYPQDNLIRQNDWIVEYRTPSDSEGLGTINGLPTGNLPVQGVAILRDQSVDCLFFLAVRLPSDMANLAQEIIKQAEHEYGAQSKP